MTSLLVCGVTGMLNANLDTTKCSAWFRFSRFLESLIWSVRSSSISIQPYSGRAQSRRIAKLPTHILFPVSFCVGRIIRKRLNKLNADSNSGNPYVQKGEGFTHALKPNGLFFRKLIGAQQSIATNQTLQGNSHAKNHIASLCAGLFYIGRLRWKTNIIRRLMRRSKASGRRHEEHCQCQSQRDGFEGRPTRASGKMLKTPNRVERSKNLQSKISFAVLLKAKGTS